LQIQASMKRGRCFGHCAMTARPNTTKLGGGMTQDWNERLKRCYKEKAVRGRNRGVRLPESGPMTVTGEGDRAIIFLRRDAVVLNMRIIRSHLKAGT
jgi:hypothetical protein